MKRRDFLKTVSASTASFALGNTLLGKSIGGHPQSTNKPNILFILTDQQTLKAMSAYGNSYIHTPAMDSIAANGVRFENSYCTSPVCGPSRSSLVTGAMPHETGVIYNGQTPEPSIPNMGEIFREAGYETAWVGKWHLPDSYPVSKTVVGFDYLQVTSPIRFAFGSEADDPVADKAIEFLKKKRTNPFLLAVSFHNPHDICWWFPEMKNWANGAYFFSNEAFEQPELEVCPTLPSNFEVDTNEPEFIQQCRNYTNYSPQVSYTKNWDKNRWRRYMYAYYRLTEKVDKTIGRLLTAFRNEGLEDNTLVIFTSDHGDGLASHKWVCKLMLYQESVTVPFIVSWKGVIPAGAVDRYHLVSGLDVLPTMCDYAGVKTSARFRGRSLRSIIEKPESKWRSFVVSELAPDTKNHSLKGRMVRTSRYKYIAFSHGKNNEQLFDLRNDPGETKNLARETSMKTVLKQHRNLLSKWILETKDNFDVPRQQPGGKKMDITITSPAFEESGLIPAQYTCDGSDISPPLRWESVPEGTRSIALICDDPDAPMGTWVHWVLFNLPADTKELAENIPADKTLANGARQGTTDFRRVGYGGPCPPSGTHRYFFKIYALDTEIDLAAGADKEQLLKAMEGHILGQGQLIGKYKRQ